VDEVVLVGDAKAPAPKDGQHLENNRFLLPLNYWYHYILRPIVSIDNPPLGLSGLLIVLIELLPELEPLRLKCPHDLLRSAKLLVIIKKLVQTAVDLVTVIVH